jgi:succinate-semialdehyde dehydrogenase / glutarate-semialdehyde dehydrogenase
MTDRAQMRDTLTAQAARGTRVITTIDPSTGRALADYPATDSAGIDAVLDAAMHARACWAKRPIRDRCDALRQVARTLRSRRGELALMVTTEMGKPLREAAAEVDKCAATCDFFAENAARFLAPEPVPTHALDSWVSYEPIGTVLAVMPWNFPLWQVIRAAAPALAAGNAVILKHSPNTSGCAVMLADVLAEAGLPAGLFGVLIISEQDTPATVERLLAGHRIDAVTITGSERAGSAVALAAGRAIKPSVLELGGSDAFVVLDDADVHSTVAQGVRSRFLNAGQSCISAKRFVVADRIADAFVHELTAAVQDLVVGDPQDPRVDIGPLARQDLVDVLERQVSQSLAAGARLHTGGSRPDRIGWFYHPTVLAGVRTSMPVCAEETFGPVAVVITARDDDDAVAIANDTRWGLGASVWTSDVARGRAVAGRLRSGAVFVNAVVASDPRLPFGGTGRSGYGRELGLAGIREFVNVRTWWIDRPPLQAEGSCA